MKKVVKIHKFFNWFKEMEVFILEKIIKNNKIIQLNYLSINLVEGDFFIVGIDHYNKKNKERIKKLEDILKDFSKKETYNVNENMKNNRLFEMYLEQYLKLRDIDFNMVFIKENKPKSVVITSESVYYISLTTEQINKIILDAITNRKNILVEIENNLDKKKISYVVKELVSKKNIKQK